MSNRFRIESIDQPTRYWLESHAVRGWFDDKGAASQFGEGDRMRMTLPVGGCWVIIDEPKAGSHHFTTIKLRPVCIRLSATEGEYEDLNAQVNEFEAALRLWVKGQQVLVGDGWVIDVQPEEE